MSSNILEKSLDEIIGESTESKRRFSRPSSARYSRPSRDYRPRSYDHGRRDNNKYSSQRDNYRDRYEAPRRTKLQRLSDGKSYIKITNLHPEITKDDLEKLLETIGPVAFVEFDLSPSGRHSGIVHAGFRDESLNIHAVEKFDGRKAANQIIDVEEIKPLTISSRPRHDTYAPRNSTSRSSRPIQRDNRPRKHERKPRTNVDDLDRELEEYMKTSSSKNDDDDNRPFPIAQ
ncbi:hypothetical protein WICMUC_004909 [Wickerhamomyces mucosus]|uniref:RRM domain-containing protein n=1 Tax=Wickerhamomyces mucosus TaxID=1378264 RepID=A0A9P8PEA5_9ASCO|nr:hypothetical protein WICMUC_004909 [Wickerhamomyces mucosus]